MFRNGATIFPICLVRVAFHKIQSDGQIWIKTKTCRHNPWRDQVGQIEGIIPSQWLRQVLFANDMLPFGSRLQPSYAIIPTDDKLRLISQPPENPFWETAEREWSLYRGEGPSTPATLIDNLNYHNKLRYQFDIKRPRVIYNNSGTHLRAMVVADPQIVVENALYYLEVDTIQEAHFLAGILNSNILQPLYRRSRKTDRHFAAHIWHKIPIPAFQQENPLHEAIIQTAIEARHLAEERRDAHDPDGEKSQPSLFKLIRNDLKQAGLTEKLDSSVAELLKTMRKYSQNL